MKVGAWNVRGLKGRLTMDGVVDLLKQHQVSLFGIFESKLSIPNLNLFFNYRLRNWNFAHNFDLVDNGRMVVLWDPCKVDCVVLAVEPQCIHCQVTCKVSQKAFVCTFIYGFYSPAKRKPIWDFLKHIGQTCTLPWAVLGDFNVVKSITERIGGVTPSIYQMKDFDECCSYLGLDDSPATGEFYTWTNNSVKAKLDRVLINDVWQANDLVCHTTFHKMRSFSDHCPSIVEIFERQNGGTKPFKFFSMWLKHPKFEAILKDCWAVYHRGTKQFILSSKLKALKKPLKTLNKEEFGHISERADRASIEFQEALGNLNVITASDEEKAYVNTLRLKANFLLDAEKQFFAQKLKIKHLISADKGSKYFHSLVKKNNQRHSITSVLDITGNSTTSMDSVGTVFVNFFKDLFGKTRDRIPAVYNHLTRGNLISPEDIEILLRPVTPMDIRTAVFNIGDEKSPGPDGFSASFFKANWEVVGQLVTEAILEFFRTGKILKQWNHTCIALIPKKPMAQSAADFRPIACCNVSYKIITKILADRLALVLPRIIDQAQGAFVGGRIMSENIFLAQELIRGYGDKKSSARCMVMVDLRKAYDTIDWDFLREVLLGLGFPTVFVGWILECVSTTSFSISINGTITGLFKGKRGLRQGDPMSPLLFNVCLEYFSRLLTDRTMNTGFKYHPKCEKLRITHLAFADDLMLFSRGDETSVQVLMDALRDFENTSGLAVNIAKSNIFAVGVRDSAVACSGLQPGSLPVRYLGIPLDSQRLKVAHFESLYKAISTKIDCWKGHTLSKAGRLELIRAVIQGIVSFWMQNFALPTVVKDHIISLCRKFLWGNNASPVAWDDLCLPKKEGGLGLHHLPSWNSAFFARIMWNIHSKRDSLWVRWVHAIYLKGNNFWTWDPGKRDSALIKNITKARDILIHKFGGIVPCLNTLALWAPNDALQTGKVYEALRPKKDLCHFTSFVWKSYIPPKHSFIAWLALRGRLATKDRLSYLDISKVCPLCDKEPESASHLFFACDFAASVWDNIRQHGGFNWKTLAIRSTIRRFRKDYRGSRYQSKFLALALIVSIYHIWKARNSANFDTIRPDVARTVCMIERDMYRVLHRLYPVQDDGPSMVDAGHAAS